RQGPSGRSAWLHRCDFKRRFALGRGRHGECERREQETGLCPSFLHHFEPSCPTVFFVKTTEPEKGFMCLCTVWAPYGRASQKSSPPQPRRGGLDIKKMSRSILGWSGRGGAGPSNNRCLDQHHPVCAKQGGFATLLDRADTPPQLRRGALALLDNSFHTFYFS